MAERLPTFALNSPESLGFEAAEGPPWPTASSVLARSGLPVGLAAVSTNERGDAESEGCPSDMHCGLRFATGRSVE